MNKRIPVVGDRIKLPSWPNFYTVKSISNGLVRYAGFDKGIHNPINSNWEFEPSLIDPTTEAISLLTSLGYDVVPPKPKLSGKTHIYAHPVSSRTYSLTNDELHGRTPIQA